MFLILILGTLAISFWASSKVKSNYHHYSRYAVSSGLTGAQTAALILQRAGIHDVQIGLQPGELTDHYDPVNKRLMLSEGNYHGHSIAAVAVAAHEAGHALQHASAYAPLHLRHLSVGVTHIASQIVMWLPLIGMFTLHLPGMVAMWIIAIGWGVIMGFNLITLPVEFDASERAKKLLTEMGVVSVGAEAEGVSKMLGAAAWTYVAAFLTSLGFFLWHLLPLVLGRHDD